MKRLLLWQIADLIGQCARGRLFWAVQDQGFARDRSELHQTPRNAQKELDNE